MAKVLIDYMEKKGVFLSPEEKKNLFITIKLINQEGGIDYYSRLSLLDREEIVKVLEVIKRVTHAILNDPKEKEKDKKKMKIIADSIDDLMDLEDQIREREDDLAKQNNGKYEVPISTIMQKRVVLTEKFYDETDTDSCDDVDNTTEQQVEQLRRDISHHVRTIITDDENDSDSTDYDGD